MANTSARTDQTRILLVCIAVMTGVSVLVTGLTIWILYSKNFDDRVEGLQAMLVGQAALIEAVARFDAVHSDQDHPEGAWAATLSQIVDGYSRLGGFGETGEFVVGQRRGDQVVFLSTFRFPEGARQSVPLSSERARPMRRALSGESGWVIGPDYRGERVLAAYQPIRDLDIGLVAKMDMQEITSPALQAAGVATAVSAIVILIGALLVLRVTRPMLEQIAIFKQFAEEAGQGFGIATLDGKVTYLNPTLCQLLGLGHPEAFHGRSFLDVYPEDKREQIRDGLFAVLQRDGQWRSELSLASTDGTLTPTLDNWFYIRDADGTPIYLAAVMTDITERKAAEEALRKLSRATEQSPATVVITDRDGTIEYLNPKFTEVTGYALEEAIGQNPRILNAGVQQPEFYAEMWDTILAGREWHGEFCNKKKNGELYWESASISPLRGENGEITHFVGVKEDITERKEAEQALAEAGEAAEAANRAKSAFLANMSHELRTPMNAIIGYSEMLAEELEEDGHTDYLADLEKVRTAGQHLLGLINDILDLSKIEAGRMELYLERFELREMLDQAVDTVLPLVDKNGNRLETEFADDLGTVRADLTKLRQSLFNLLSNAAKFTREGVITLRADRLPMGEAHRIVLSVSDTGIGIPEEKLGHVFEEFSQADDSTTREFGGTGLGLAISRRYCRMMGGDLTLRSAPGKGSTFTINIPAYVHALQAARAGMEGEGPIAGSASLEEALGGVEPGTTVLVIEDNADARETLRRTLAADGLRVMTAVSGERGLQLARELRPAVITLDVILPGMDGWEVLRELKSDPDLRRIPVVMVTILNEEGRGLALGAAEYMTKPVDRKRLLQLVSQYAKCGKPGRLLVVEDDVPTREIVCRSLAPEGWEVDEASNGREALERMHENVPDLVILDLMMPVMDGFGFLREARAHAAYRDVPVIVLTAKQLQGDEQRLLEESAVGVVRKDGDDLETALARVREVVGSYRQ